MVQLRNKGTKEVMKDPKRQEAVRKDKEKYVNKLKESILNEATKSCSRDTSKAKNDAIISTTSATISTTGGLVGYSDTLYLWRWWYRARNRCA